MQKAALIEETLEKRKGISKKRKIEGNELHFFL
jgi:hypothetical protein